jgi:hypothetical protein
MKKGQKYNRLTVVEPLEAKNYYKYWLFKCDCGNYHKASESNVEHGLIKSCGCLKKESLLKNMTTHGMCGTKFYNTYNGMMMRCYTEDNCSYKNYGARGIGVCNRWHKFEEFKKDMLDGYSRHVAIYGEKGTVLGRKNMNGNFTKRNCFWTTMKGQNRKRRDAVYTQYKGKKYNTAAFCEKFGINRSRFETNIRNGWTLDEIIARSHRKNLNNMEVNHRDFKRELIEEFKKNKGNVRVLMGNLDSIERNIIDYRLGFDNGVRKTLKETGERVNYSRERVRQLEKKALAKIFIFREYVD